MVNSYVFLVILNEDTLAFVLKRPTANVLALLTLLSLVGVLSVFRWFRDP